MFIILKVVVDAAISEKQAILNKNGGVYDANQEVD